MKKSVDNRVNGAVDDAEFMKWEIDSLLRASGSKRCCEVCAGIWRKGNRETKTIVACALRMLERCRKIISIDHDKRRLSERNP